MFYSFIKLDQVSTAFKLFNSWMRPVKSPRKPVQVQIVQKSNRLHSVYKHQKKRPDKLAESWEAKSKQVQKLTR